MVTMNTTGITRFLKLPFQFDEEQLVRDFQAVQEAKWTAHFNTAGYEGDWKVIPLYAPKGDPRNIFAMQADEAELAPTPLMQHCPYFQQVIRQFKCPLLSVRLLKLGVGAEIKPHRDHELGYEDGCFRLHIPIITNPQVSFLLDGEKLDMQVGECWYTNVNHVHSVANRGQSDRVHLVLDGARNDWSDELFFSLAPPNTFFPDESDKPRYSRDIIMKMIAELEKMDNEVSRELIVKLRAQIG
jgi:quercetin dioxygenase-like cupin family protein